MSCSLLILQVIRLKLCTYCCHLVDTIGITERSGWWLELGPFCCMLKMVVEKNGWSLYFLLPDLLCYILLHSHFHKLQSVSFQMIPIICISLLQGLSYRQLDLVCHFRRKLKKSGLSLWPQTPQTSCLYKCLQLNICVVPITVWTRARGLLLVVLGSFSLHE